MRRRIREGDYILMTSDLSSRYLQIGEVIEVKNYPHSNDVMFYRIRFNDTIMEYSYEVEDALKVLMFER